MPIVLGAFLATVCGLLVEEVAKQTVDPGLFVRMGSIYIPPGLTYRVFIIEVHDDPASA